MGNAEFAIEVLQASRKLQGSPFAVLDDESLRELAQGSSRAHFRPGQYIVREGDRWPLTAKVYFLASGVFIVERGGTVLARMRSRGAYVGEMAVLNRTSNRTATVKAGRAGATALVVHRNRFMAVYEKNHAFRVELTRKIAQRRTDSALKVAGHKSVVTSDRSRWSRLMSQSQTPALLVVDDFVPGTHFNSSPTMHLQDGKIIWTFDHHLDAPQMIGETSTGIAIDFYNRMGGAGRLGHGLLDWFRRSEVLTSNIDADSLLATAILKGILKPPLHDFARATASYGDYFVLPDKNEIRRRPGLASLGHTVRELASRVEALSNVLFVRGMHAEGVTGSDFDMLLTGLPTLVRAMAQEDDYESYLTADELRLLKSYREYMGASRRALANMVGATMPVGTHQAPDWAGARLKKVVRATLSEGVRGSGDCFISTVGQVLLMYAPERIDNLAVFEMLSGAEGKGTTVLINAYKNAKGGYEYRLRLLPWAEAEMSLIPLLKLIGYFEPWGGRRAAAGSPWTSGSLLEPAKFLDALQKGAASAKVQVLAKCVANALGKPAAAALNELEKDAYLYRVLKTMLTVRAPTS